MSLCEETGIIMQSGILTLGGTSGDYNATLEIGDGAIVEIRTNGELTINSKSSIIVKDGGSLLVSNGAKLSLLGNSKIIVESGGFICVDPGATIDLRDVESVIELHPGATTGINPALGFSGNCTLPCSIAYTGSGSVRALSNEAFTIAGVERLNPDQEEKYSVPLEPGLNYWWHIEGGEDTQIIAGQGSSEITVKAGSTFLPFQLIITATDPTSCESKMGTLKISIITPVNALAFNGENDFVNVADRNELNFETSDFTFEVNFQSNFIGNATVPQILLSKRTFVDGSVADGFILGVFSTGEVFVQLAGAPNHLSNEKILNGSCHHIAVTRRGDVLKIFIGGVLSGMGSSERNISSPGDLSFGHDVPTGFTFNGQIGEVRLWNKALTDQEVLQNIRTSYNGTEAGLVGLWNMNVNEEQALTNLVDGTRAVLGNSELVDDSDPEWVLNSTCDFSMFRIAESNTGSGFITDAQPLPMADSLAVNASELHSFPNPTTKDITLYVKSDQTSDMHLEILDTFGNLVYSGEECKTNEVVKIPSWTWNPGIYVVRVRYENQHREIKIIKK